MDDGLWRWSIGLGGQVFGDFEKVIAGWAIGASSCVSAIATGGACLIRCLKCFVEAILVEESEASCVDRNVPGFGLRVEQLSLLGSDLCVDAKVGDGDKR